MADTITIVSQRPFWLPPKAGVCEKQLLSAGKNTLPLSRWKQTADHPAVVANIAAGVLTVNAPKQTPANYGAAGVDAANGLVSMTIAAASVWIDACDDVEKLRRWRSIDKRKGIHQAIDLRIVEIEGLSTDDFGDDGD